MRIIRDNISRSLCTLGFHPSFFANSFPTSFQFGDSPSKDSPFCENPDPIIGKQRLASISSSKGRGILSINWHRSIVAI